MIFIAMAGHGETGSNLGLGTEQEAWYVGEYPVGVAGVSW